MTRAELAAWLGERYGAYLAAVNRTATDTAGNLKAPIDDALRALGFAEADLLTATTDGALADQDLRIQASYRVMAQVARDLATSFDIATAGDSFKLSQMRAAAEKDLKAAEAAVLARFGTLDVVSDDAPIGPDLVIDGNFLLERVGW